MSAGPRAETLTMAVLGLALGTIGIDPITGYPRFAFGVLELGDGVGVVQVAVGLFGISEILLAAGSGPGPEHTPKPARAPAYGRELRPSMWPIARGCFLGFIIGIIPGSARVIASFVSYGVERRLSKAPRGEFGQGAIEGVASPVREQRRGDRGARPDDGARRPDGSDTAVMIAAVMVHGVAPGPKMIQQQPPLFWGFVASMYIGNLVLLILNLPMVGFFVCLLRIPYAYLYPAVIVFCVLGVYALNQSLVEVWIMTGAGALGYLLRKLGFDVAPVVLGMILAPMLEQS